MFNPLTNLNLIKILTTTDELSIKHITNNERMAHDVEEAVQELVEDYSELCEEYSNVKDDIRIAENHINNLEQMLNNRAVSFKSYTDKINQN